MKEIPYIYTSIAVLLDLIYPIHHHRHSYSVTFKSSKHSKRSEYIQQNNHGIYIMNTILYWRKKDSRETNDNGWLACLS